MRRPATARSSARGLCMRLCPSGGRRAKQVRVLLRGARGDMKWSVSAMKLVINRRRYQAALDWNTFRPRLAVSPRGSPGR